MGSESEEDSPSNTSTIAAETSRNNNHADSHPGELTSKEEIAAPTREPMPSTFHPVKLVPMASTTAHTSAPIMPPAPATPANSRPASQPVMNTQSQSQIQNHDPPISTPTSESRMNPPPLPRSLVTPVREMREGSVSTSGGSTRKPRQNLDERDHIAMLKACYDQKHNYKEGTKAQFWSGVNQAFQHDTGKILAQMSATVGRLVEVRRRQISDWENGIIADKPGGELNERLDQWMEYLKVEDGDAEAERMRQVDARRKTEEQRKEARRQAIAAESLTHAQNPGVRIVTGPAPPAEIHPQTLQVPGPQPPPVQPAPQQQMQYHDALPAASGGEMVPHPQHQHQQQPNGQPVADMNGYRPQKRRRVNETSLAQDSQQLQHEHWQAQQQRAQPPPPHPMAHPPDPPRRVVVEGAMTKEDWRDVMGNDARLRSLEAKIEHIEVLLQQNNKLLHQLMSNQISVKERERNVEEDRVPVHLDAEFERDYL